MQGGTAGATAPFVVGRTAMTRDLADEPERRSGYQPTCGQQLLDAIHSGQPFRTALRDLGLTSNQVWGLTRTDDEWLAALETALTATRRDDLQHGTNAAYLRRCVCPECREHQRLRMARNR
jgi:hypothetical protein